MGLLSKPDIEKLINQKHIFCDDTADLIQPASVDITVGKIFVPPDPNDPDCKVTAVDDFYDLRVGSTALVVSEQQVKLTEEIGGFVFPKNGDFALKGVLFTNFGHIDPGFQGHLKFTVINMGRGNFQLKRGTRIAGVVLFKLTSPTDRYTPRHIGISDLAHAKILSRDFLDVDNRITKTVKDLARSEWVTRERKSLFIGVGSGLLAVVAAIVGLMGPLVLYDVDKISAVNFEIQNIQHQLDGLKAANTQMQNLQTQIDDIKSVKIELQDAQRQITSVKNDTDSELQNIRNELDLIKRQTSGSKK